MGHIQIRTGNGLRARLATTVSFENLFTELVKNSLQNNATEVRIKYDDKQAVILDNGTGFDHVKDDTGLNEFEKYFVFGNSYTKAHKHLNLGQMGIGGKAANDKLSDMNNTHWSLTTKNKRKKCFRLTFKSSNEKYLDDIQPTLDNILPHQTAIPYKTGTRIVIHNLDPHLIKNGWPGQQIHDNLQQFFNMLYFQTAEKKRNFKLFVNDKPIKFDQSLPGTKWKHETVKFNYKHKGKTQQASYTLMLNRVDPRTKHLLNCVDLVSYARVCSINWEPNRLQCVFDMDNQFKHVTPRRLSQHLSSYIRGYVLCDALSDVKDDTGMSAKDLSHHRLNPDHPVTQAFLDSLYRHVGKDIIHTLNKKNDPNTKLSNTLNRVCNIMFKHFNIPDEFITTKQNTVQIKRKKD